MTSAFSATQIDRGVLLQLTDRRFYERGLAYAEENRVRLRNLAPLCVEADVEGSETYNVHLAWRDDTLHGECDCPVGQDGLFCKHQVAVAMTWARAVASDGVPARGKQRIPKAPVERPQDVIRHWLAGQPPQALQALLLELAEQNRDLRQRLLSQAQLSSAPPQDWRKAVSAMLGRKRFMDYRDSIAYAKRLAALPALLEQARQRNPVAALDLHEYAFKRLLAIYENCDDSAGHIGERLRTLGQLHPLFARSSSHASTLAKRLFDLRMLDGWKLLPPLQEYAHLLESSGVAILEHAALQALHDATMPGSTRRLLAESVLEETARCGGSVDTMLHWFASHCSSGSDYLQMARRCAEHGRERQAIEWLERGAKAHPQEPRILAALAQAYSRDGFPEDALQLCWKAYLLQPTEAAYLALREAALALGPWPPWRERALQSVDKTPAYFANAANDTRIRLLLAEGEAQRALQLAAEQTHKLPSGTWERLLPEAETHDPPAALHICHTLLEDHIARTTQQGYLAAVDLLPTLQRLHRSQGDHAAFDAYLAQLRQRYRIKRNFIALLDKRFPAI